MSKIFHVVNIETNERYVPEKNQYLVLYDSGKAAIVSQDFYTYIKPLDSKIWKVIFHDNLKNKIEKQKENHV